MLEPAVPFAVEAAEELEVAAEMVNWFDWARMVLRSSASLTRLTWKPAPVFQPPLGGFTFVWPRLPSTRAART